MKGDHHARTPSCFPVAERMQQYRGTLGAFNQARDSSLRDFDLPCLLRAVTLRSCEYVSSRARKAIDHIGEVLGAWGEVDQSTMTPEAGRSL
jgi:hypothetical protein